MYKYFIDQFQSSNRDDNQLYGIRAISCFLVIVIHTFHFAQNRVEGLDDFVLNYVQNFEFIMDIFFLMSAYLVSVSFIKDYSKNGFSMSWKNFVLKRSFRIFPLILFILFIYVLIWRVSLNVALKVGTLSAVQQEVATNIAWYSDLFYISNYFENRIMPHGWSLSLEEQFYLALPVLLFVLTKTKKYYNLTIITTLFLLVGMIIRGISYTNASEFDFTIYKQNIFEPTHTRFEPFIFGMFLAIARLNHHKLFFNNPKQIKNGFILSTILLIIFNSFTIEEIPFLFYTTRITIFSFFSFFLIYFTLENKSQNLFKTLLSNRLFVPIGKLSYGIYLIHFPVVVAILDKFRKETNLNEFSYFKLIVCSVISLIVTFILANLTYILIEKPFIRMREWTQLRFDISKNIFYSTKIDKAEFPIVVSLLNVLFFLPYVISIALLKVNFFFGEVGKPISYILLIIPMVVQIYHISKYKKSYFSYLILKYQIQDE